MTSLNSRLKYRSGVEREGTEARPAGFAIIGSREDDVVHLLSPELFALCFSEHPPKRVKILLLPLPLGPTIPTMLEGNERFTLSAKDLNPFDLDGLQVHFEKLLSKNSSRTNFAAATRGRNAFRASGTRLSCPRGDFARRSSPSRF